MPRATAIVSVTCAALPFAIWAANMLEATALQPSVCTYTRMTIESYLFMARVAGFVLPPIGLLLAVTAAKRVRSFPLLPLAFNIAALLCALGIFWLRWIPLPHLPCLRS
jgi:hypothetical protein